jgi:hypothetical protein
MDIPPNFDDDFLRRFKDRTNATWSRWPTRPFSSYQAAGVGGEDWQRPVLYWLMYRISDR